VFTDLTCLQIFQNKKIKAIYCEMNTNRYKLLTTDMFVGINSCLPILFFSTINI